jgi:hypothetical protein
MSGESEKHLGLGPPPQWVKLNETAREELMRELGKSFPIGAEGHVIVSEAISYLDEEAATPNQLAIEHRGILAKLAVEDAAKGSPYEGGLGIHAAFVLNLGTFIYFTLNLDKDPEAVLDNLSRLIDDANEEIQEAGGSVLIPSIGR